MSADHYRVVSALPTGTAFSRFMMVLGESRSDRHRELTLAEGLKIRRRCMARWRCGPKPQWLSEQRPTRRGPAPWPRTGLRAKH